MQSCAGMGNKTILTCHRKNLETRGGERKRLRERERYNIPTIHAGSWITSEIYMTWQTIPKVSAIAPFGICIQEA